MWNQKKKKHQKIRIGTKKKKKPENQVLSIIFHNNKNNNLKNKLNYAVKVNVWKLWFDEKLKI